MTRWGFISDVHGNRPALEQAIGACRANGAEQLVYLGDLLGRGNSDACVDLVRATAALSVVGNRDLDWAERVSPNSRAYVLALPRLAEASDFVAAHGDARLTPALGSADLRRGFGRAYGWLRGHDKRLLFFGHTHHARAWRKASLDAEPELLGGWRVDLPAVDGTVYLVNVGTTGLPFPGKGPPCCAVYDDRASWLQQLALTPGLRSYHS
jgi:predicted phosphodiesterase